MGRRKTTVNEAARSGRRPTGRAALALAALVLAAACGGETDRDGVPADVNAAEVLGPEQAAAGTPVKFGLISGKGSTGARELEALVGQAAVKYLNQHKKGIAGRPIELITCETGATPATAADCANRMVEQKAAVVVVGSTPAVENVWQPLHDAKVPTMFYAANGAKMLGDRETTFALADPFFPLVTLPVRLAKEKNLKSVTVVVIDVPTAMAPYQTIATPDVFEKQGITLNVVPVPLGTADMTPQMQRIASGEPGLVQVIGNDSFCIGALNGLRAVGFDGPVTATEQCFTDATRKAVPASSLKGIVVAASHPSGADNPSTLLYKTAVATYGEKGKEIDTSMPAGMNMFSAVLAVQAATTTLEGEVTPQSITAAIKNMPEQELPVAGGRTFRCGGGAQPAMPAVCAKGGFMGILGEDGHPAEYTLDEDS
ncbi:ABC transporter substrate-binding protein [Actinocorallia populi]|uniref:ABC transporter substrate-binding protein n=1 Tax=Actinocorallia populi TaxID=2079200 RepID=UPI000D08E8DC|nr:ABC transporter substrate-binding protein [Actinocorallia populi]